MMTQHLRFRPFHVAILLISGAFYHKMQRTAHIQQFLREHSEPLRQREAIRAEYAGPFREAIQRVGYNNSPAVMMLNKHALNVSLNFVCNLHHFPGATERLIAVVFDAHSEQVLRKAFPALNIVHWRLAALEHRFGPGDGRYQLFQYFRAMLAAFLTEVSDSFWMVQADTIWSENLFNIFDVNSAEYSAEDVLLDSEGHDGLLRSMVAGGYFFVRSSPRTREFFASTAQFLLDHFATDNNVMTRQCSLRLGGTKCAHIPYSVISNWRSVHDTGGGHPSPLFQFDGGASAGDKFDQMRAQGHLYVDPSTVGGNEVKCLAGEGPEGEKQWPRPRGGRQNWALTCTHGLFEWLCAAVPALREWVLTDLFPYYGAHLFI